MKKKFNKLVFLIFSLWGLLIFSCASLSSPSEKNNGVRSSFFRRTSSKKTTSKKTTSKGNLDSQTVSKEKTADEAFLEVVKVLHAPYEQGKNEQFFKIFTGANETNETKKGSAVSVKGDDNSIEGKGSWSVKAGKDNVQQNGKDDSIVYTYAEFQPKGSKIIVDGTMKSMYRSKELNDTAADAIGFNKNRLVLSRDNTKDDSRIKNIQSLYNVKSVEQLNNIVSLITLGDILTITGEYEAKLEFIYPSTGIHPDVGAGADYEKKLISDGDTGQGMFTVVGSTIEFTYNGKTEKLTKEQITKLIRVA